MEQNLRSHLLSPAVLLLLLILLCNEFIRGALLMTALPLYLTTNLGLSRTVMGAALAVHYILDDLLRSPAGWVTDHVGPKPPLVVGILIELLALFTLSRAHSIGAVFWGCGLFGIGASAIWPSVITGVTSQIRKDHATIMGIIIQFSMIGAGLGPILINLVTDASNRNVFSILLMGLAIPFWIVAFLKNRSTHNSTSQPKTFTAGKVNQTYEQKGQYWLTLLKHIQSAKSLFPGMFAQTFALSLLLPVLTLYAKHELHLSHWWFSVLLASGGLVTIIGIIPFGRMVDHFGGKYLLIGGFFLSSLLFLLFPLLRTIPQLLLLVCLIGLAYALVLPSWNGLLNRCVPANTRGAMWGIFMTVEGIGTAAGPMAGGALYDVAGPNAPFWTSACVFAIMALVYMRHPLIRDWTSKERR